MNIQSSNYSTKQQKSQDIELIDVSDKEIWDGFVAQRPETNFLQSFDFYEFHKARGLEVVRRAVKRDGQIVACYAGVVEHAKRGKHLAVAGGPILDWHDKNLARLVVKDIREQATKLGCVFARIRPQCEASEKTLKLARDLGLKKAPMYLSVEYAGVLDLNKTDEELMAGMRQRLRRALRKGAKNGITIEVSTNPKDIHEFYQIQLQTAKRHDFYAFGEDFLTKQFTAFAREDDKILREPSDTLAKLDPHGEARLYIAKKDGEILAENFMIFYGNEASYHYGVSSELGTKLSGAPLLHVQAMKDARAKGIKRYSFWGIVAEDDTKHRFYGVSQFKRGFGVDELKYLPAHDLVIHKFAYLKTWIIETLRRKIRHV
ncbi:peptidoglycan bridge formation glycyltransferase FemA/FemB family protein [Candidatus Saccharibacteria bacterium]|nr:peptidoglycan bridge formation glycyltransferase FemA/FemB family protein [Candidatus Saccharibacteria bacterium]